MAGKLLLLIDDKSSFVWWAKGLLKDVEKKFQCDVSEVELVHVLPDKVRNSGSGYAEIHSFESFLETRRDEVTACLLDIGLPGVNTHDLCAQARAGDPPFGAEFACVPLAMVTAADMEIDLADHRARYHGWPVFTKMSKQCRYPDELVEWLANALKFDT